MKQETFFDINDNELIVSYLHFPVTRNRDFWGKSLIELYDFVLSRIEREKIDINEGHLEYLLLRMSIENGGIFTYLPFNKKVLRGYLSDIKKCFLSDKNSMYSVSDLLNDNSLIAHYSDKHTASNSLKVLDGVV